MQQKDLRSIESLDSEGKIFIYMPLGPTVFRLFDLFLSGHNRPLDLIIVESHGDFVPFMEYFFQGRYKVQNQLTLKSQRHSPKISFIQLQKSSWQDIDDYHFGKNISAGFLSHVDLEISKTSQF